MIYLLDGSKMILLSFLVNLKLKKIILKSLNKQAKVVLAKYIWQNKFLLIHMWLLKLFLKKTFKTNKHFKK